MATQSVTTSKNNYTLILTAVENSTSTEANTSNISVTLTLKANGSYIQGNRMWGEILIDGVKQKSYDATYSLSGHYASLELASYNGDVAHNADGTRSITVSATLDSTDGIYPNPGNATVSLTLVLSTIPRKSNIGGVSLSGGTIEQGFSVSFTPASPSFSHRLELIAGGRVIKGLSYASGQTVRLSGSELLALYRTLGHAGSATVQLYTLTGSTVIGTSAAALSLTGLGNIHLRTGGGWQRGLLYVGNAPAVVMIKRNGEWTVAK